MAKLRRRQRQRVRRHRIRRARFGKQHHRQRHRVCQRQRLHGSLKTVFPRRQLFRLPKPCPRHRRAAAHQPQRASNRTAHQRFTAAREQLPVAQLRHRRQHKHRQRRQARVRLAQLHAKRIHQRRLQRPRARRPHAIQPQRHRQRNKQQRQRRKRLFHHGKIIILPRKPQRKDGIHRRKAQRRNRRRVLPMRHHLILHGKRCHRRAKQQRAVQAANMAGIDGKRCHDAFQRRIVRNAFQAA